MALPPMALVLALVLLVLLVDAAATANTSPHPPTGTKCCNGLLDPARCSGNGTGMGGMCFVGEGCGCAGPGWVPASWRAEAAVADRLIGSADEPGPAIANGYVGAWTPKGMPGSAGPAYVGREFVMGVMKGESLLPHSGDSSAGPYRTVSLAPLASWTATAHVAAMDGNPVRPSASALDLRRGAYEVVTPSPRSGGGGRSNATRSHCIGRTYAHRSLQHLLITEFQCMNHDPHQPLSVTLKQRECPEGIAQSAFTPFAPLCPKTNASLSHGSEMGYVRVAVPSALPGVSCSRSTMGANEHPSLPPAVVAECHTSVPRTGLQKLIPAAEMRTFSLISTRFSNMDLGVTVHSNGSTTLQQRDYDPVALARAAWSSANASRTELFPRHIDAMATLNTPGIEIAGNVTLARLINSSMYSLLGNYRTGSPYGMAPEGLISTRYNGYTFCEFKFLPQPLFVLRARQSESARTLVWLLS
jgi:hypothetical protein